MSSCLAPFGRLTQTVIVFALAVCPAMAGRGASLGDLEPSSPLHGGSWILDEGFYLKIHNYPEDSKSADFLELINRLHTSVRVKRWNVGVQIDAVVNAPPADSETGPVNPLFGSPPPPHLTEDAYLVPEKVWVHYRGRHVQMELGDSYINVGKGIALSLVRRPEIDEDTSLRGIKLGVTTDPVDWKVFFGWANAQNISVVSINRGLELPAGELVFGTSGLVRPARWMEFGLHAVGVTYERPDENGERRPIDRFSLLSEDVQLGTFGASLRFPRLGPLDWYTEGDLFVYGKTPEGERAAYDLDGEEHELNRGYAVYTGVQAFGENVAFLAEVKRYKDHLRGSALAGVTENSLAAAPTLELEEAIQPNSQHAVTSNAMTGYRLRWTWYVPDTAHNIYVNFANFFDDADVPADYDREIIFHPYAGVQLFSPKGHHLFFTGGYRGEANVEDDTPVDREYGDDHMVHAYIDGAVVVKASTFEVTTNVRAFREATEEPHSWVSSESSLSWNYKGVLTVAALLDATNERSALNGPLAVPGNLHNSDDPENPLGVFGAIEVTVRPTPAMAIKLFAGANKQGLRCTGGVCRWLPGFSGFRTEFTVSL